MIENPQVGQYCLVKTLDSYCVAKVLFTHGETSKYSDLELINAEGQKVSCYNKDLFPLEFYKRAVRETDENYLKARDSFIKSVKSVLKGKS